MNRLLLFTRWFVGLGSPKERPTYARINIEDWRAIKPGDVRVLRDEEGHAWGLMHLDDIDHIFDLAGLQRRVSADPTTGVEGRLDTPTPKKP